MTVPGDGCVLFSTFAVVDCNLLVVCVLFKFFVESLCGDVFVVFVVFTIGVVDLGNKLVDVLCFSVPCFVGVVVMTSKVVFFCVLRFSPGCLTFFV